MIIFSQCPGIIIIIYHQEWTNCVKTNKSVNLKCSKIIKILSNII